jgi:hypothetical protein
MVNNLMVNNLIVNYAGAAEAMIRQTQMAQDANTMGTNY